VYTNDRFATPQGSLFSDDRWRAKPEPEVTPNLVRPPRGVKLAFSSQRTRTRPALFDAQDMSQSESDSFDNDDVPPKMFTIVPQRRAQPRREERDEQGGPSVDDEFHEFSAADLHHLDDILSGVQGGDDSSLL
jgi:hypothetical protein